MTVADSAANLAVYSRQRGGNNGGSSYPMLRLLALVSCGTRTVIDAVSGPVSSGETTCAPGLLASLHAGMILLADRNFGAGFLAAQIAATDADFLIRVRGRELLPEASRPAAACPTGPGCRASAASPSGSSTPRSPSPPAPGTPRAAAGWSPPSLDPARYPARELAVLYHERWVRHEVAWCEWNSQKEDRLMLVT